MTDKEIIDVTKCIHFDKSDIPNGCTCYWDGECNHYCYYKKYTYKHQECEELKRSITKIFACLIKANRTNKIVDTLWVDDITTLWDYIALTLGIKGDQTQIEEQILKKNQLI